MSRDHSMGPPGCDDDVAGLFMKLGDGKGRPEYRDFPEAALPQPTAAARPAKAAADVLVPQEAGMPPAPAAGAAVAADTPLSQLFRRLAETGGAIADDSPLIRLRGQ
ncbi:MAG: hypothetical protein J0I01_04095 [Stenotrophomonas nitritireducens]|uniref:hypothetical protein n=1 Tax=Stenotrophomonas TaxID=40323 RepID=UPI001AD4D565|nr:MULTISPECIES: hypothetical protein [Stenotrophomonas]MBN8791391.1 hypothetical protein [Stenotrophomonas nitritireducens]MBN8795332.1 hypothetical protein [Stenotrophomonas nitritireducens]